LDSLDWSFIVGVILSFTAIVLVYDGINGEKQRGTPRSRRRNRLGPRSC
jgi:hypothetical protein